MYLIQSTFARRRGRDGVEGGLCRASVASWGCGRRRRSARAIISSDFRSVALPGPPLQCSCVVRIEGTYYILYTAAGSVYAPFLRGGGNNAQSPSLYYNIAGPTIAIVRIPRRISFFALLAVQRLVGAY